MKRYICCRILVILVVCLVIPIRVAAAENDLSFSFELTANGKETLQVQPGEIITLTLKLRRTDNSGAFTMYGMQDEICYDSSFLELVEGSEMLGTGIASTDIAKTDRYREFYMNYLSMSGGSQWDADTVIGSVQFRVIGQTGVTTITNQDYLVSWKDGSRSYPCEANEVTLILSTECVVSFESKGGTPVADQTVWFGEKIDCPDDPTRDGYVFGGWFTDIHLQDEWDFDNDTVQGNMTLYAKWTEQVPDTEPEEKNPAVPGWLPALLFAGWIILLLWKHRNKEKNGA